MFDYQSTKKILDSKYEQYCQEEFILPDPIQIPHLFHKKEDIEIAAFLSATIAWGQRPVIIKNAKKLMGLLEYEPYNFILNHTVADTIGFAKFRHRTLISEDIVYFLTALKNIYTHHGGLEKVVLTGYREGGVKQALIHLNEVFFSWPHLKRTEKHLSNPLKNSAAKRLNMFLRWMVRTDKSGIDFGLWTEISPGSLMLPLDVHTATQATKLGLLTRKTRDWPAVEEVTANLRLFDPADPVKYDFALFGMGVFRDEEVY
jgi:uncharacterized protein (TIGR02757 family)